MNNSDTSVQYVVKRDGTTEIMEIHKIYKRIKSSIDHLPALKINAHSLAREVSEVLESNITTSVLDEQTCKICNNKLMRPYYNILASRIIISNHHKNTRQYIRQYASQCNNIQDIVSFSNTMHMLYNRKNKHGNPWPAVNDSYFKFVMANNTKLNDIIHYENDYRVDYFGFKTLEKAYLLKDAAGKVLERPQDMYLRIAVALHMTYKNNISKIKETYKLLSNGDYSHASPTLFNAGTNCEQFASCFLLGIGDSCAEIMKAISDAAAISSSSGGIGMHWSDIRSKGASINRTNGISSGPLPFMQIANWTMKGFNQGGKRPGSMAIFIEPWHADIVEIINARHPHIEEDLRAKDLFYALWIPDLFMEYVRDDKDWYLMCPKTCSGLPDVYGKDFEKLYNKYVAAGTFTEKIKARNLYKNILTHLIETGIPYIGFKDHVNNKSNQQNIGTIKSSNLCMEIMEYSDTKQYAVCVLSSVALPNFLIPAEFNGADTWEEYQKLAQPNTNITDLFNVADLLKYESTLNGFYSEEAFNIALKSNLVVDHRRLFNTMIIIVQNLNIIIDKNLYPNPETKLSNMLHRPLGIGVQGLANLYLKLKIPFDSSEAAQINRELFETMYYSALWASSMLAKKVHEYNIHNNILCQSDKYYMQVNDTTDADTILPGYYPTFKSNGGCPYSKGQLQYRLWGKTIADLGKRWDWSNMEQRVITYGLRNSQLLALMPTASTSQILGNNECFEPITSNVYTRKVLAGEFLIVNADLIEYLHNLNLLTDDVINNIIENDGSAQHLSKVLTTEQFNKCSDINLFKTVWEMDMKSIMDQAADRGVFICQSQSMNLWKRGPTVGVLSSMYMYAWEIGLKTGGYYLRSQAKAKAAQHLNVKSKPPRKIIVCTEDVCTACT